MGIVDDVRDSMSPSAWRHAVEAGRRGTVTFAEARGDHELWLVRGATATVHLAVTIWPASNGWECSCGADDTCLHVAAAVDYRDRHPGASPAQTQVLRVIYRLAARTPGRDRAPVLEISREVPPGVVRSDDDRALDRILLGWWDKVGVPRRLLHDALAHLTERGVSIEGRALNVSATPVRHLLIVEDGPDGGVRLRLARGKGIVEAFPEQLVRVGDTLHRVVEDGLSVPERQRMVARSADGSVVGWCLGADALDRLVREDLPRWKLGLDVDLRTGRLPQWVDATPRLSIEGRITGGGVRIVARVVYGDPVVARVVQGELVRTGRALPRRDPLAEDACRAEARAAQLSVDLPVEWPLAEAAARVQWLPAMLREEILRAVPQLQVRREAPRVAVETTVRPDGDFDVRVDGGGADPGELVRAWKRRLAVVPLLDGTWAPLPVAWMDTHGAALEALLAARDSRGRVARGRAVALVDALQDLDAPLPPDLGALRVLAGHFESLPDVVLPADVHATLRPYQLQGVAWIDWLRGMGMGGILADDMGLGKTVQTLVALRLAHEVPSDSRPRHLVVAPTSVVRNWISEAARFVPTLRTCLYHGARRVIDPDADIVVTTYALLRLDLDVLRGTRWTTVVLDEAQAIKNPDSQAARAAFTLEADLRLALSGTPIENRLEELWSAFHFVNPGLLGSLEDFRDRTALPIESGDRVARDRLRRRIRPFLLRRLKKDVARDLPPRTDIVLRCALSTEERAIYERVRSLGKAEVASYLEGGNVMQVLEVLLRMRQAACHSGLVPGAVAAGENAPSAKLDLLCEQLDEVVAEGHRALVFSQWTSMLDRVGPALDARGIGWVRLDGSTRDRAAVVADFARSDGPPVFLLSLKAGGTGLNLTAADYVFHLDPWWNPAVEDQATDRAHRIGQDRPVVSCKLVAEDTVEERILELQARKRALVGAALDEEALARSLSRDDLAALFD